MSVPDSVSRHRCSYDRITSDISQVVVWLHAISQVQLIAGPGVVSHVVGSSSNRCLSSVQAVIPAIPGPLSGAGRKFSSNGGRGDLSGRSSGWIVIRQERGIAAARGRKADRRFWRCDRRRTSSVVAYCTAGSSYCGTTTWLTVFHRRTSQVFSGRSSNDFPLIPVLQISLFFPPTSLCCQLLGLRQWSRHELIALCRQRPDGLAVSKRWGLGVSHLATTATTILSRFIVLHVTAQIKLTQYVGLRSIIGIMIKKILRRLLVRISDRAVSTKWFTTLEPVVQQHQMRYQVRTDEVVLAEFVDKFNNMDIEVLCASLSILLSMNEENVSLPVFA